MTEPKTKPNDRNVEDFLNTIPDEKKREDSFAVLELMRRVLGEPGQLWGENIVGFRSYPLKYPGGREELWPRFGFSPRKQTLTLYGFEGLAEHPDLASRLGKYTTGKTCLYVKKLADVDMAVLEELIRRLAA